MRDGGDRQKAVSIYTQRWVIAYGNFMFRYRNLAFPVVLIVLTVLSKPSYPYGSQTIEWWMDVVAILVAIVGQGVRAAVVGLEYIKRGGRNKRVYADRLVTGGIFAYARNPLYVGNIILIAALLIIADTLLTQIVGTLFTLFTYVAIVAAEEEYLRGKFGPEYEAYCRQANRWLPRLRGLGKTLGGMTFNWRRVIIKEYSSVYSWILAALALELHETLVLNSANAAVEAMTVLAGLWLVATVAFLTAGYLKKTKRLTDPSA